MRRDAKIGTIPRVLIVVRPTRGDVIGCPDVLFRQQCVGLGHRHGEMMGRIKRRGYLGRHLLRRSSDERREREENDFAGFSHG